MTISGGYKTCLGNPVRESMAARIGAHVAVGDDNAAPTTAHIHRGVSRQAKRQDVLLFETLSMAFGDI
jgi:hypothetical protein